MAQPELSHGTELGGAHRRAWGLRAAALPRWTLPGARSGCKSIGPQLCCPLAPRLLLLRLPLGAWIAKTHPDGGAGTPSCARSSPGQSQRGAASVPSQGKQREEKMERNEIRQKQQEMKEMNQMGEGAGEQSHGGDFAPRSPVMNEALIELMISQAPLAGCSLDLLPPRAAQRSHGCWRRWDPARASHSQQQRCQTHPAGGPCSTQRLKTPLQVQRGQGTGSAETGFLPKRSSDAHLGEAGTDP